ncbi:MAG TPA: TolC family protein [Usitatibacter sp.]|nr:TolC family protein [Usitatibacter sp.]
MKQPSLVSLAVACAMALPAFAAAPLALEEALAIAQSRSPQLAAQRASAEAAEALVGPASENPDPKLFLGIENLPAAGADRFSTTLDAMTMRRVGVMQDFVREAKRRARGEKAQAESERERAMVAIQAADVRREVALAWVERHYAERSRLVLAELAREADLQAETARAGLAAGRLAAAEPLAARALRATLADRIQDTERQARRATALLERWIGEAARRPSGNTPVIGSLPRKVRMIEADPDMHPDHAIYAPLEAAAEADLRLARAATQPDWSVELSYGRRGGEYAPSPHSPLELEKTNTHMVSLMFKVDLPLFGERRQDPVIVARARQLEQVRAQTEEARRRHVAEVRATLVDWETSLDRLKRHRDELVPLAQERVRAALAAYEGGRMELAAVLEARRGVIEARLAALAVEAEAARAWAQLAYLVPEGESR